MNKEKPSNEELVAAFTAVVQKPARLRRHTLPEPWQL